MKKVALLAMALVASSLAFGQELRPFKSTAVFVETQFQVVFTATEENPYIISFEMFDTKLIEGDTVVMGPAKIDSEFRYILKAGESHDAGKEPYEFWIDKAGMQLFADYGLEYVKINSQLYWLDRWSRKRTKKLARRAFNL